jgi:hypothetical protein
VPYEVAFNLPPEDVAAYGIVFGEMEGNIFDWNAMRWTPRDRK